jgi:hypothetical protein
LHAHFIFFFSLSSFFFFSPSSFFLLLPERQRDARQRENEREIERLRGKERQRAEIEGESKIGRERTGEPGTQGTPATRFPADATDGSTLVVPRTQNPTNLGA